MANDIAVREWTEFPEISDLEFDKKVREYRGLVEREKTIKSLKYVLKVEIEAALMVAGEKRLRVDNLMAVQCNGSTASRLDAKMLVSAGVDADIIVACTVPGTKYTYIQVKEKNEKGEWAGDND